MRIVQEAKKPEKNLPLSQAGSPAVLSCHRQRRRGAPALAWDSEWLQPACGSGHQLTSAESQALTGLLAPARAPPSGHGPGASTIQPGGCPRASTRSWLSRSPTTPRALGPPPRTLLPAPASHPARCASSPQPPRTHSLEGALQGYGGWGLARTAATGLHRRSPPAPGLLPPQD